MKYIKTFESLRDDYAFKMREIENLKKKAFKVIKSEVDDYMNYILDDYQIDSDKDEMFDVHEEKFEIHYHKIKVPFNDIEDKFLPLLKNVEKLLKEKLDVDLSLACQFELVSGGVHSLNFGYNSKIYHLEDWLKNYNNLQLRARNNYTSLNLSIKVL